MNKSLHVGLEHELLKKIDCICENNDLKRSTVVRMYLIRSLSRIVRFDTIDLQDFRMVFDKKLSNVVVSVSLQIPEEVDQKLDKLCDYIPISKKKLAEMLVMQEIRKADTEQMDSENAVSI